MREREMWEREGVKGRRWERELKNVRERIGKCERELENFSWEKNVKERKCVREREKNVWVREREKMCEKQWLTDKNR